MARHDVSLDDFTLACLGLTAIWGTAPVILLGTSLALLGLPDETTATVLAIVTATQAEARREAVIQDEKLVENAATRRSATSGRRACIWASRSCPTRPPGRRRAGVLGEDGLISVDGTRDPIRGRPFRHPPLDPGGLPRPVPSKR